MPGRRRHRPPQHARQAAGHGAAGRHPHPRWAAHGQWTDLERNAVQGGDHGRADRWLTDQSDQPRAGSCRATEHHRVRLYPPGQHERLHPSAPHRRVNSPGGYVYIVYGEDTFGRDEAVQTLKERMRALPAGEHNLTELGPETTVAALRLAADVVPFLTDRRMVF